MPKKTPARRYTQTRVPSIDTQLEIKVMVEDARDVGLSHPEWHSAGSEASVLRFLVAGRPCQIALRPDADEGDPAAELRRLHRVLLHFLKNVIEAARSGLLPVGEALMASHITTDGKMLGEAVFASGSAGRPITLALPEARTPEQPTRGLVLGPARGPKR